MWVEFLQPNYSLQQQKTLLLNKQTGVSKYSGVAQRKRVGPITQRSADQNGLSLSFYYFSLKKVEHITKLLLTATTKIYIQI